jgi:hypothetical protein
MTPTRSPGRNCRGCSGLRRPFRRSLQRGASKERLPHGKGTGFEGHQEPQVCLSDGRSAAAV